jgi:hypothetical protein
LEKYSQSTSSLVVRDAFHKMVLLRWSVGAVDAVSVPGGAVGGARFGVLRLGEGRVPNRDYVQNHHIYLYIYASLFKKKKM